MIRNMRSSQNISISCGSAEPVPLTLDSFTEFCAEVFTYSNNILTKQKAIDVPLDFAIDNNRWPSMRIIKNSMLVKLSDNEVRLLAGYFKSKKDSLDKLEDAIQCLLPNSIRIVAGL